MGTLAAGMFVLLLAGGAVYSIWKDKRSGKYCAGCSGGCGGCKAKSGS